MNQNPWQNRAIVILAWLVAGCGPCSNEQPQGASSTASSGHDGSAASASVSAPPVATSAAQAWPAVIQREELDKPLKTWTSCKVSQVKEPVNILEQKASKGDGCAKLDLANRIREQPRTAERYRQVATLVREAHEAGIDTGDCDVFELGVGMAQNQRLAAECHARGRHWSALAVYHVGGFGVPKDLTLARALVEAEEKAGHDDCTLSQVKELIDREEKTPTDRKYTFCADAACTTIDLEPCHHDEMLAEGWIASQQTETLVSTLSAEAKPLWEKLLQAAKDYQDADSEATYYQYIEGTLRGMMAIGREAAIQKGFHLLLSQILKDRRLEEATNDDLKGLGKQLDEEHRGMVDVPFMDASNGVPFRAAWKKSQAAWARYQKAWTTFAVVVLSGDGQEVGRRMKAALVRQRITMLQTK